MLLSSLRSYCAVKPAWDHATSPLPNSAFLALPAYLASKKTKYHVLQLQQPVPEIAIWPNFRAKHQTDRFLWQHQAMPIPTHR